jgi:hypothetical protein
MLGRHSRRVMVLKIALPSMAALFAGIAVALPKLGSVARMKLALPRIKGADGLSFTMDKGAFLGQGDDGAVFNVKIAAGLENKNSPDIEFTGINGEITMKDQRSVRVSSQRGKYAKDAGEFEMRGSVRISDQEDNRLFSDQAKVDIKTMEVSGKGPVAAMTDFGQIIGEGFSFKRGERYEFFGRINGRVNANRIEKSP